MSFAWYVVQTHPNSEARAEAHLRRQGFETYLPRYRKSRRHARRTDEILAPLFPRYVFVAIDTAQQRWRAVQSTLGVTRLVTFGDAPAALGHDVIQQIKSREQADGLIALQRPCFQRGEAVRVCSGPLEACMGLFESITDGERIAVLLDFLGRKARVILHMSSVAAA